MMENYSKDINLKDYFVVLGRGFWMIVLVTILATVVGYLISNQNKVLLYQTSTRMIIGSDDGYMKTLMVMIKDPLIMEKVREELKLSRPTEALATQLEISRIDESQVVLITAIDEQPEMAAAIANTTAKAFKAEVDKILEFDDVQLLSAAKENPFPINDGNNSTITIAFAFGLIAGIGLVFLLDAMDSSVRKEQDVEKLLGVPVLGVIPNMNKRKYRLKFKKEKELALRGETVDLK